MQSSHVHRFYKGFLQWNWISELWGPRPAHYTHCDLNSPATLFYRSQCALTVQCLASGKPGFEPPVANSSTSGATAAPVMWTLVCCVCFCSGNTILVHGYHIFVFSSVRIQNTKQQRLNRYFVQVDRNVLCSVKTIKPWQILGVYSWLNNETGAKYTESHVKEHFHLCLYRMCRYSILCVYSEWKLRRWLNCDNKHMDGLNSVALY